MQMQKGASALTLLTIGLLPQTVGPLSKPVRAVCLDQGHVVAERAVEALEADNFCGRVLGGQVQRVGERVREFSSVDNPASWNPSTWGPHVTSVTDTYTRAN